jgi:5-phospho-D-xylono-1,4-lactonase
MTGPVVRTVLGDIPADRLGRTDIHEHLLMRSPLLRGDALDDVERSGAEAGQLRAAGLDAVVELTPIGLGRDPRGIAAIAARTGLHIVMATGLHHQAHYPPEHWAHRVDEELLAELFVRDLTAGCCGADYSGPLPDWSDIRAGVIKTAAGYRAISAFEARTLRAAAEAHRQTGAPIVCHLEEGTAGPEVLEVLTGGGVAPDRVALAHLDRNLDPELHADIAAAGAYICYDGIGRAKVAPDAAILSCLLEVAGRGHERRILIGADVARASAFRAYGGGPGLAYLPTRFLPRLARDGGAELHDLIMRHNPAAFLGRPS